MFVVVLVQMSFVCSTINQFFLQLVFVCFVCFVGANELVNNECCRII